MSDEAPTVFLTVRQFCERHAWARPGGIRHAIFHGDANGFSACVVRFGRKVLLDEAKVIAWLRTSPERRKTEAA